MARRLPSLNAIRAFEAAARHMSFTRAADELNVTQAAVSHQVKALEDTIGVRLFRRTGRQLMLTDEGQALFPGVRDGLDGLAGAFSRLNAQETSGPLTITALPSFVSKWLIPRLRRFQALYPEIDVRISTSVELVDLNVNDMDLAIRSTKHGSWPGMASWKLLEEEVFPVCSPSLLEGEHPLRTPADLAHHTLLQDFGNDWQAWLEAAGVGDIDSQRGPGFLDSSIALQAAIEGMGVWLGRSVLAADDLAAGRLTKPFDITLPWEYAYWLVCPKASVDRPKVKAFRDWILAEAAAAGPQQP